METLVNEELRHLSKLSILLNSILMQNEEAFSKAEGAKVKA